VKSNIAANKIPEALKILDSEIEKASTPLLFFLRKPLYSINL
jgi:hypothetical protein